MKPLLLIVLLGVFSSSFSQSLDYLSIRKKNGRVVKNFYSGSTILLETESGSYFQGPISSIRNDSVFITVYDIRLLPTTFGSYIKDTVSTAVIGLKTNEIRRIQINQKTSPLVRLGAPLLMLGGAGYFTVNVLNGAFFNGSVTGSENIRKLGISVGAFGLGYLIRKIFSNDGFTKSSHRILYVDL